MSSGVNVSTGKAATKAVPHGQLRLPLLRHTPGVDHNARARFKRPMLFSWFKQRRRRVTMEEPFPTAWLKTLEDNVQHWHALDAAERLALEDIIQVLLREKHWEGCGGLTMRPEIQVTIAAQAALLILAIPHDYFQNVQSVLVYPSSYVLPRTRQRQDGVMDSQHVAVQGSAHHGGPVVLSWDNARAGGKNAQDGRNLVFHEFAHKLDMLDGMVDGTPELDDNAEYRAWIKVMTAEFEALQADIRKGRRNLLDPYAATDVAEFFAVATEVFFEKPRQLREKRPDFYAVMKDFYEQDPAARLDRAAR